MTYFPIIAPSTSAPSTYRTHEHEEHDMSEQDTTAVEPIGEGVIGAATIQVTLGTGGGHGHPLTDTRSVPLNIDAFAPDLTTGMKTFSPGRAEIVYRRHWRGHPEIDAGWSPWRVQVHVRGPRRLTSGALSERAVVEATYRPDAAEGSTYALPAYLRPFVEQWHPEAGER